MKISKRFENYPGWIVLIYNAVFLSLYFAGIYLLYQIQPWLSFLFFIYIIYLEASLYKKACRYCYYYGKVCGAGKGKIVKLFFKKGEPKKFGERTIRFKDFIPQLLISIMPLATGIYLLIKRFDWFILVLTIWPLIIWFFGNPILYGKLICPNCKQGNICCPASDFFIKKQRK